MGSITLDWTTFALEIINFLVLLWLLRRFLYRPISDVISRRRARIEQTLNEGRLAKERAEMLEKQYQSRVEEWEREKTSARARLAEDLDKERSRRQSELTASIERERSRREAAAARDADQRRREMEHSALRQGAAFASRLAVQLAGPELEVRIVQLAVSELQRLSEDKRDTLRAAAQSLGSAAIKSAYPLADAHRHLLAGGLNDLAGKKLNCAFATEPTLVAGIRIELGAWVFAANLCDELSAFAESGNDSR